MAGLSDQWMDIVLVNRVAPRALGELCVQRTATAGAFMLTQNSSRTVNRQRTCSLGHKSGRVVGDSSFVLQAQGGREVADPTAGSK